jgi:aminoglycoside phosphotransferase (APT) family kinase protein
MIGVDKHLPADPDNAAATAWLGRELGLVEPVSASPISGGWSNITYLVTDGVGRRVVVRRPPTSDPAGGAHDVLREAALVSALRDTAVPVPVVVAQCADPSVAPHPFYATVFVPGTVVGSAEVAGAVGAEHRGELGFALVDTLADLQALDIDAVGLGWVRRRTPYLQRQLRRWTEQWRTIATRDVPAVDGARERLAVAVGGVDPLPDVLVHGDFRFGNVIIDDPVADGAAAPRIAAVLDWELATTGHRLADLGFLGARMQAPDGVLEGDIDPSSVVGYPSFDELSTRFTARTGVPTQDLPVFVALAAWRWAIIVEGIACRIAQGAMSGGMGGGAAESAAWHRRRVELLAGFAAELLG